MANLLDAASPFHPTVAAVTLFPEMFHHGPLQTSLVGKALQAGRWHLRTVDLRCYGLGRHQTVDDAVYGGGAGMVFRPDVVHRATEEAARGLRQPRMIYVSPRGTPLCQQLLDVWAQEHRDMVVLCGRYEGVDQRVLDHWDFQEISIGDFVVCGGELPAMLMVEGYIRLLEGVVGNHESLVTESFQESLLEHPQYTRPAVWHGRAVPDILLSGHHEHIRCWRLQQSQLWTEKRRPDLWKRYMRHGTLGKIDE